MLGKLFLAFTVATLVELWLLIELGRMMGVWGTLALVFGTGFLGAWLARQEGVRVVTRMRGELDRGRLPTDDVLDGVIILVAGAFLVTPGVITDAVGLGLLLRPLRRPLKRGLRDRIRRWLATSEARFVMRSGPFGSPPRRDARRGEVVDVRTESADVDDESGNDFVDVTSSTDDSTRT